MGNMLDSPRTEKDEEKYTSSSGLKAGASGMQGYRLEMEDSHIQCDFPTCPDHMLVSVFDGHGGQGAAIYAAANLMAVIEANETWKKYLETGAKDLKLLSDALSESFLTIDVTIRAQQDKTPADQSGCTAVICVVTTRFIMCANAGDSRCVIGTNKEAKGMSEDHKPDDTIEKTRIEKAGGYVHFGRVEGNLAVSRAFGDFEYKNRPDLTQTEQKVSCLPDIFLHYRSPQDDVLLLACDGLWDVMSNAEAISELNGYLTEGGADAPLDVVASRMLDSSLQKGSKDNISAVIVDLRNTTVVDMEKTMPAKYGRFGYEQKQ
jgi:protein phosphatase 1B